jgi:transcriptional regulator with PAS, ATPase and Fis domain
MQQGEDQLLFYLNALYEFANEISKQRSVEEILKRMLCIVIGTFGITKGIALVRHARDSTFELVAYEHLDLPIIESVSQQLHADITDDLEEMNGLPLNEVKGLIELSLSPQSPATPKTIGSLMSSVGMAKIIVLQVQERLTAYVALGPMLSDTPFSEHQIELLSALTTHTEIALGNALFYQDILQENQQLKEALHKQFQFDNIVGQSAKMQEIYKRIQQIARYPNYSVLISGESGTGKELIARAIHHHSPRKNRIFLPINCVALPAELVESELFGYEKGAFTGATTTKPGLFEVAEGGTLFLDEIADMPTVIQAKLLRTLEQKEIMRIGGSTVRPIDVRVIAATNKGLKKALASGQFRNDLFYRFDVQILMPPLRDRKEDIPLLASAFLEEIARENQQPAKVVSQKGLKTLMDYSWPGNVRELKKVLMQAVMVTEDTIIQPKDIPLPTEFGIRNSEFGIERNPSFAEEELEFRHSGDIESERREVQTTTQAGLSLKDSLERLKRTMIEKTLRDCNGNKTKAAAQLGMTRQNLQNMMRRMKEP